MDYPPGYLSGAPKFVGLPPEHGDAPTLDAAGVREA
jgi:hypothetical protein